MKTKVCRDCGETLPISNFYFRQANSRYEARCKSCYGIKMRTWRKSNSPNVANDNQPRISNDNIPFSRRVAKIPMIGLSYGKVTVIAEAGSDKCGNRLVKARCECGATEIRQAASIRQPGYTCFNPCPEKPGVMSGHPLYKTYSGMLQRCENPNSAGWEYYGGRGITVCERWRNSFQAFLDDMGERPKDFTLDRIDFNGNYSPENYRLADSRTQAKNRRPRVTMRG